jgi:membrane associated rhomboid family serine protease
MFLVPLAHERMQARRWPIVTTVLIALSAVVLVLTMLADRQVVSDRIVPAIDYVQKHPYLDLPPSFPPQWRARYHPVKPPAELTSEERELEQSRLNSLASKMVAAINESPVYSFGYIPARPRWYTLVTYAFLHGGWLHFLFNGWFLWLCGCNIEDRWGRWVFLGFYLSAAIVAALVHGQFDSHPDVVLIGASGAIAAAMGAFLVLFATTRIRFGYFVWIIVRPIYGTFLAPALVMLPLWLLVEVFYAMAGLGDGTAHWAHVGGFVFGLAVAGVARVTGIDSRLDSNVEKSMSKEQDPQLREAGGLIDAGLPRLAIDKLQALLVAMPNNIDAGLELLRAAVAAKNERIQQLAYERLLTQYVSAGMLDTATELGAEMVRLGVTATMARERRFALAEDLSRRGGRAVGRILYNSVRTDGPADELALRAQVAEATILIREGKRTLAEDLLADARESPLCSYELRQRIEVQLEFAKGR